jgi:hypothetical protein
MWVGSGHGYVGSGHGCDFIYMVMADREAAGMGLAVATTATHQLAAGRLFFLVVMQ